VPPPRCGPLQAPQEPKTCAYNAPAEINVGIQGEIDFFASGSFIYWLPAQDNMNIALVNANNVFVPAAPEPSILGNFVDMNFKFKPGFKAGLGMNLQTDDWDGYAEYTRVHGHHQTSTNGTAGVNASVFPTWGHPFLMGDLAGGLIFQNATGRYRNHLDFVDAEMGRTYYVGKSLIFRSAWGARAAWILQSMHAHYEQRGALAFQDPANVLVAFPSVADVYQRIHSWGVGPRTGLMMDWMLGWGLRYFGSAYADILYTKYRIKDKTVLLPLLNTGALRIGNPMSVITRDRVGTLRTHLDFETGFGWGSYFDNNNWHIDLALAYGWQVFFSQNMFRHFEDNVMVGLNTAPHGDLFVQGLTATLRVDF